MFIEAVDDEFEYEVNGAAKKIEGSDGHRTYVLLESGELCKACIKNPRMQELGIEKISFQVYQIAGEKLFNVDFKVAACGGKANWIHFSNKVASEKGYLQFFSELKAKASEKELIGLELLANQAVILASRPRPFPSDKDSAYLRCMDACDDIEFELFKLLCYTLCLAADDTPGS